MQTMFSFEKYNLAQKYRESPLSTRLVEGQRPPSRHPRITQKMSGLRKVVCRPSEVASSAEGLVWALFYDFGSVVTRNQSDLMFDSI